MSRSVGGDGTSTGVAGVDRTVGNRAVRGSGSSSERRLLASVTQAAADHGYAELTVERVLVGAGVSRATFYQYFTCLDDCFWSAYREHALWLVGEVASVANRVGAREPAVLGALVDAMASRPSVARVLAGECMAAGQRGLVERDGLVMSLAGLLRGDASVVIDVPARTLIGASLNFLATRIASEPVAALRGSVLEWAEAFAGPPSRPQWSGRFNPPDPVGQRGLTVLPQAVVAGGSARDRILRASMLAVREHGFRGATVADIVAAARVSRRHFYNEFSSKRAAVTAAYELGFQRTLEACTPAFFSRGDWPERVWCSALAFTGFFAREPLIAHLGFVECYAIGRQYVPRVNDTQLAFTLFLEEGFRVSETAEGLSRACAALTAAAIFDLGCDACRRGHSGRIRGLQPMAVFIALAPFLGTRAAGEFVEGKLSSLSGSSLAVA